VKKAFKFRLDPNVKQQILLAKTFGSVRRIWNDRVNEFNQYAILPRPPILTTTQMRSQVYPWMQEVSAAALQQKDRDWIEFKSQYFSKNRKKKLGRPQFKKKGQRQSFRLPNGKFGINPDLGRIRLEKVGQVRYVTDSASAIPDGAKLISITISQDGDGRYYASVLVEVDIAPLPKTGKSTGIDLGLKSLIVLSNGVPIENPQFYSKSQAELRMMQKHLSRKDVGSVRYNKVKSRIAQLHSKVARARDHYQHTLSSQLVKEHDFIGIEALRVENMKRNRRLAKSISDAGLAGLVDKIEYKAAWYGKTTQKISPCFPSSKRCSGCGNVKATLSLGERVYRCACCGLMMDRDLNAAINIEVEALRVSNALRTQSESQTDSRS
jgi:putative transposase